MSGQDQSGRIEPSAPPMHMMYNTATPDERDPRDRSPPPRYEEAIAEDLSPPVRPHQSSSERSPFAHTVPSHQSNNQITNRITRTWDYNRQPNSCNSSRLSTPNHSPEHRQGSQQEIRGAQPNNRRHRSASPDEHLNGDSEERYESRDCTTIRNSRRSWKDTDVGKQRGSGSKIKKGLENIAFFFIRILD